MSLRWWSGGGGAAGLGSTVAGAPLWRCSSCVHAPALFGVSLLGDVKRLRRWHTGVVASSRPRVTVRMHPRRRWCRGVVQSWLRDASDCVDGAVPWLVLGWPMPFDLAGGALCCVGACFPSLFSPVYLLWCVLFLLYPSSFCAPCNSGSLEPILR